MSGAAPPLHRLLCSQGTIIPNRVQASRIAERSLARGFEQHVLGLVDLRRKIRRAATVGMQPQHQFAMRTTNFIAAGTGVEAQNFIGLIEPHPSIRST